MGLSRYIFRKRSSSPSPITIAFSRFFQREKVAEGRMRAHWISRPPGSGKVSSGRGAVAVFGPGNGALIHDVNQLGFEANRLIPI